MVFQSLTDKISTIFKRLKTKGKLSEKDVKEVMHEICIAFLEADVNYKVVKSFTKRLTDKLIGSEVLESLTPSQTVIKIVNEELTFLMGQKQSYLQISSTPPTVVLLCGLQGSGKTTHAAKLALSQKKKGHRPLLVACDIYRPAAIEQLKILASKIDVPTFDAGISSPVEISSKAINFARDVGHDLVIIDTAGRLQIDEKLMQELSIIKSKIKPDEILLVVDSMTGQIAVDVSSKFDELLDISGVILTKLDGDARGGAALSIREITGKPIKFVGTGEKLENLEDFHPDRMASRILGMGDVLTLIEEASSKLDKQKSKQIADKFLKNKIDLNDLLEQFKQVKKMGSIKSIISKLPGISNQMKGVEVDDGQFDKMQAIILSMTKHERSEPKILNFSRKKRIAAGSGSSLEEINKLLRSFNSMKKMATSFKKKKFGNFNFR